MKLPTYQDILPYIADKLVSEQPHPEDGNVRIFNYTQKCQFSRAWDDVTRQCRGLILNVATGECLARPFAKFFNHGELEQRGQAVPDETPEVYEKLDGSLGILYWMHDRPWIATRGSFTSSQAAWATAWFRRHMARHPHPIPGTTALFEIIYPENRIVVSYDFSGLVHLATLSIATGQTVPDMWPEPIRAAKRVQTTDLAALAAMDEPNSEGFVVYYPQADFRMKIKLAEYVRLHKIVTGVSEIGIWEVLKEGKSLDSFLENVPDEFFVWVKGVQSALLAEHQRILQQARAEFAEASDGWPEAMAAGNGRKWIASRIANMTHPSLGFAFLDGKIGDEYVWRLIRPKGQSAFTKDIDV
jgi:RNA ligase